MGMLAERGGGREGSRSVTQEAEGCLNKEGGDEGEDHGEVRTQVNC